ncbi:MAG: flavodoxin family protein [Candidatus Hydrogenedentes bacterium]|nr:flavodoxin family protein [Candidatus Hydrogenedentota bacterium]
MNVVVLDASPKGSDGNTAFLLEPLTEGMNKTGADIDVVHIREIKVKPCIGCYHCWTKEPGKCVHDDDMVWLMPKLASSNIIVLATPLYVDGMAGPMKLVLDRMLPAIEWKFELRNGHCRHPVREGFVSDGKVVLLSNCGFWELDNFDPLVAHVKAICENMSREFAAALLRPHGPALKAMVKRGMGGQDVLDALRDAGQQLVETGSVRPETLTAISRELLPRDHYIQIANMGFERQAAKKDTGDEDEL